MYVGAVFINDLLNPDLGLIFWTTIAFLVTFFLLSRYAWKPMLGGIKAREKRIAAALASAKQVEDSLHQTQEQCRSLLQAAQAERKQIVLEAESLRKKIVEEAKQEAQLKAQAVLLQAEEAARAAQEQAFSELKQEVAQMTLRIAEQLLRKELKDEREQLRYIDDLLAREKW